MTSFIDQNSRRRVHENGLSMLNEHYAAKRQQQNLQKMENRVKRLQYEEDRAKKMATLAEERAEKMITARNRHLNDFEEKKRLHQ